MMERFRRFMEGRCGPDMLSIALLVASMLLSMLSGIKGLWWLQIISYAALAFALFRILSRSTAKRFEENRRFLSLWGGLTGGFRDMRVRMQQSGAYHFYKCPKCGQRLRVPRGKGKLSLTCPKCKHQFVKKT